MELMEQIGKKVGKLLTYVQIQDRITNDMRIFGPILYILLGNINEKEYKIRLMMAY